jgi:allophanate hydrolase
MLEIAGLHRSYRGGLTVSAAVEDFITKSAAGDPALWISRVPPDALRARARDLEARAARDRAGFSALPLFGVPFAVKDNIDVAGMPTTAGCPAFAYTAQATAPVVEALVQAGAILVGKTNLDQFAAGLVGTRSPYGIPRNPFGRDFIPGGSSSGSAVAVASGLASFALGTDTAGSGRVPAAFNNIVGVKPTRGLLSTRGVVPACRSLDSVSIFAATVADARAVFDSVAIFDPADPLSRRGDGVARPTLSIPFRFGVPADRDLEFFGDNEFARLYAEALAKLEGLGGRRMEIDFAPFLKTSELLYGGAWLAERLDAAGTLLEHDPDALLPVTRSIIAGGRRYSALDAFRAHYTLAALRRETERAWASVDVLALPTAGTIYRIAEIEAAPIALNANLGRYTNFANLLDLCAVALPAGFRPDGLPFGISVMAPAGADHALLSLGELWQSATARPA